MAHPPNGKEAECDNDIGAFLVLETDKCIGGDERSFAVRTVCSDGRNGGKFRLCSDWSPRNTASKTGRFHFYGSLKELKQTAAVAAKLCPNLAKMLQPKANGNDSLASGVAVEYCSFLDRGESEITKKAKRTLLCAKVSIPLLRPPGTESSKTREKCSRRYWQGKRIQQNA